MGRPGALPGGSVQHALARRLLITVLVTALSLTLSSQAHAQDLGGTPDALRVLGFVDDAIDAALLQEITDGGGDTFRFAELGAIPATLDAPYGDIVAYGTARVTGRPDGDLPCGTVSGATAFMCGGPQAWMADDHYLFWMRLAGPVPVTDVLQQGSYAFPVLTSDGVPFEAFPPFVWDTFQGTNRWMTFAGGPGQPWNLGVYEFDGTQSQPVQSEAFGVISGDTVALVVPASELGEGVRGFGVHSHHHDGTFGAQPDSESIVDSGPDTNTDPPGRGPDELAPPPTGAPIPVAGGPSPSPSPPASPSRSPSPIGTSPATAATAPPAAAADDDGIPWLPWVAVAVLVGTAAAVVFIASRTRSQSRRCACVCVVTIEGPDDLGICACVQPNYRLVAVTTNDPRSPVDQSKIILEATLPDGRLYFRRMYEAKVDVQCTGGGTADTGSATYNWRLEQLKDGGFDLHCDVYVPTQCPGAVETLPCACTSALRIGTHSAPCIVSVIIHDTRLHEIGHVDVQVTCGEYSEIFGFFPSARDITAITGGTPGTVKGASAHTEVDGIGESYATFHTRPYPLLVYTIDVDDCTKCDCVRSHWEGLRANPPDYTLLGTNCASSAGLSLKACGIAIELESAWRPDVMRSSLDDLVGAETSGYTVNPPVRITR